MSLNTAVWEVLRLAINLAADIADIDGLHVPKFWNLYVGEPRFVLVVNNSGIDICMNFVMQPGLDCCW